MGEPVDTEAEAVRIIGYRHEIREPGREPLLLFSESSANPWSHWLAKHLATCQYTCVPLVAASSLTAAQQRIADLEAQCARVQETYQELLFAVGKKYTGETRHQTALRYIRAAEVSGDAAMAAKGDDWLTREARQIGLHSPACASFGQNECDCGAKP